MRWNGRVTVVELVEIVKMSYRSIYSDEILSRSRLIRTVISRLMLKLQFRE